LQIDERSHASSALRAARASADPGKLGLHRHTKLQLCKQLHPPHQLRHPLTLFP